jgi:AAA domain
VSAVQITRTSLERSDLATLIREGIPDPEWLIENWLYVGYIHWLQGPPGEGKTWLALWLAARLVQNGKNVLYLDEENNERLIASRLVLLGCTADQVEAHFHYVLNPALDDQRLDRLRVTVHETQPALIVYDSAADFVTAAGLDENNASDMTRWIARFARRTAQEVGSAALILDHTPKNGTGARGSGAKKAKPEVVLEVTVEREFSRNQRGEIKVKRDKDREGIIPFERRLAIGATVTEDFSIQELPDFEVTIRPTARGGRAAEGQVNRRRVLEAVPFDAWVTALAVVGDVGISKVQAREHLNTLVEAGELERRVEGGAHQWRRVSLDD